MAAVVARWLVHSAGDATGAEGIRQDIRLRAAKNVGAEFSASTKWGRCRKVRRESSTERVAREENAISFHYTLTDQTGKTLDSSAEGEPMTFLEEAGQIIPGLEAQLRGMKVGDKKHVTIKAEDAYGEHDAGNVMEVPLEKMPAKGIKVGDRFRAGRIPMRPSSPRRK